MGMDAVVYVPLALVGIFALGFPPRLHLWRPARIGVTLALGVLFLRYMSWRVPITVLPATDLSLQSAVIWVLFAIEALAWLDAAILFTALCRRTDRSAEASTHEARLRALPADSLPVVDVFIATYNEPIEVLERTIVGALALDWPAERLKLWVLDDGRRAWLEQFCRARGAGYLTRPDNAHAKAGNINAAIARTTGEFFAVFDADFIPQRNFLFRMIGFFADPRVGIVQAPHRFFNHDPMQANLALRRTLPGDQSLFFGQIMPGRDGWDCAFCCGSNSITRRSAIQEIGNALPTGSITEDMLLTLALLRKRYVTRYLNEPLAMGLAPESLEAFFVQRARWARGALQILYLRQGPLGPGLTLVQRLMFLPTHWLTQALTNAASMTAPCLYLLTGLLPLLNVTAEGVLSYQLPMVLGTISALRFCAPGQYFPLASTVLGTLQSFRLLPVLGATLIRPYGHVFKVTPKGRDAAERGVDRFTVILALVLLGMMAIGLALNSDLDHRIVRSVRLIPVVTLWCTINASILLIAITTAMSAPTPRAEERFQLDELASLRLDGNVISGRLTDISLSGAAFRATGEPPCWAKPGVWVAMAMQEAGEVPAQIVRRRDCQMAVRFHLPPSTARDRLIRKIFTVGRDNTTANDDALAITLRMLASIFRAPATPATPERPTPQSAPPAKLIAEIAARARDNAMWDTELTVDWPGGKAPDGDAA